MAADEEKNLQVVTFRLGKELYGIDILDVKEVVKLQSIRPLPNAPHYVIGILNLRGEIIPIIDLHRRFKLGGDTGEDRELDELESGFVILRINGVQIGIIIDKISRVVAVERDSIQDPPQMMHGIGSEYITGVVNENSGYLIILASKKLFDAKELHRLVQAS